MREAARNALLRGLRRLGVGAALLLGVAALAVVNLNLPVVRSALLQLSNTVLASQFRGTLKLNDLKYVSLSRVELGGLVVLDDAGNRVLELNQLALSPPALRKLVALARGPYPANVSLPKVHAGSARVLLKTNPQSGLFTLVEAFESRTKTGSSTPAKSAKPVQFWLQQVDVPEAALEFDTGASTPLRARFSNLHGNVYAGPGGTSLSVEHFGVHADVPGQPSLVGTGTFLMRNSNSFSVSFGGTLGRVGFQAQAHSVDGKLDARLNAPRLSPELVKAFIPAWPLREDVEARATLQGTWPQLALEANVETAHSLVEARGSLEAKDGGYLLSLDTEASAVDLQSFALQAPSTSLDAHARLEVNVQPNTWSLVLTGATRPTLINDLALPKLNFALNVDAQKTQLHLQADEREAAVLADLELANGALRGTWRVPYLWLTSEYFPPGMGGLATLGGSFGVENGALKLNADFGVDKFAFGEVQLQSARGKLRAEVKASNDPQVSLINRLHFEAEASGKALRLRHLNFEQANIQLKGTGKTAQLQLALATSDQNLVNLEAQISDSARLQQGTLNAQLGSTRVQAQLKELNFAEGSIDIPAFEVSGPQLNLKGNLRYAPQLIETRFSGVSVSLARLAQLAGLPTDVVSGDADVDADIAIGRDVVRGQVRSHLRNLAVKHFGRATLDTTLLLLDDSMTGAIVGRDELIGNFSAGLSATLAGPAWTLSAYRDAVATLNASLDEVPLSNLALLSPDTLPLDVEGKLGVRLQVQRSAGRAIPDVSLQIGVPSFTANVKALQSDRLPPHSFNAQASYNDRNHEVSFATVINDSNGGLVAASGKLGIDAAQLLAGVAADQLLLAAPIQLQLTAPERQLSAWPVPGLADYAGRAKAQLDVRGSLAQPQAALAFSLKDLKGGFDSDEAAFTLQGQAEYDAETQLARLNINGTLKEETPLTATLETTYPWNGAPLRKAPHTNAELQLNALPLDVLPGAQGLGLRGRATGRCTWSAAAQQTKLLAQIALKDVALGPTAVGSGEIELEGAEQSLQGRIVTTDGQGTLRADLHATVPLDRFPTANPIQALTANVSVRELPAALISPLISEALPRVVGKLSGDFSLEQLQKTDPKRVVTTLNGAVAVKDGSVFVDALGIELQGVSLTAIARPEGEATLLELRDISARARSDEANLRGQALLQLELPQLTRGHIQAELKDVPLTLRGQSMGTASGKLDATLVRHSGWDGPPPLHGKDYLEVDIVVDSAEVYSTASATRTLIDLTPNREVIVRQQRLRPPGAPPFPYRVHVAMGDNVRLTFADQELPLSGSVGIDYTDRAQIAGVIGLRPGGRLLVLNRVFEVENGWIRLNPREPDNPELNLTLRGRGSDGSLVTVNIAGTWKEPITDPNPVELQRLLGGGTESALSSGMQALGLGALLGGAVQLRLDNSGNSGTMPSYSATVEIDDNLWFEANYQRASTNAFGNNEDNVLSGTLDYRFRNHWSLRTKVGTNNGSLDLAWQYRY